MYIHTYGWFISYLTLWTGNRTVHKHNIQTRDEIRHLLVMLGFTLHKASYLHTEDCKTRRRLITLNDVRCQMSADGAIHLPPPSVCLPLSTHPATDYLSMIATLTVTLIISLQSQFNQSNKLPSSVFSLSLGTSRWCRWSEGRCCCWRSKCLNFDFQLRVCPAVLTAWVGPVSVSSIIISSRDLQFVLALSPRIFTNW